jgi:glycosyltransferase involved in cell wall biosynthesis
MAPNQLRILHVLGTLDPGGVETWLLQVLKNIDRDRFQFNFCTFGPGPGLLTPEVERLGGKVLRCPKTSNLVSFSRRFRKILREGNYDAVHSHVHFFSGAVLRWANAEGVPIRIAHSHTSHDGKLDTWPRHSYRNLMRAWINRHATHGLAASKLAAAKLFGEDWQRDSRIRVLHNGIDLNPFYQPIAKQEVRSELGVPSDAPMVGHVGRFVTPKNHRFLVEIAREILKRRPDVHFLFVGDGPLRPEIEARAHAAGISDRIHFAGTRTDVPRIMRAAMDVFVFPSLWEGLPLAVIEAQAAGLHCILSEAVTEEASMLPEQVIQLPASKTPVQWAETTIDALGRARVPEGLVLEFIGKSNFCVSQSISNLSDLYGGIREQPERAHTIGIS